MGRKKRVTEDGGEWFFFTVDDWFREYGFGINRHPWELSPGHYDERDTIIVVGRLRSQTRRKIARGELHLLASPVPRERWGNDADRIGNAWIKDGTLRCSAWIAADVFHSLGPALATARFREMSCTVRHLWRNKGATDYVRLNRELTPIEEGE